MVARSPTIATVIGRDRDGPAAARHLRLVDRVHRRHELARSIVGQIVERELRQAARHLLGGLEVARVAARQRRRASSSSSAVAGRSPRIARDLRSDFAHASAVTSVCTLACSTNGPRAAEVERRARAVGVALVLAQVQVDAADELPAEHRVQHEQRVVVGRAAAAAATWPMRSSDCAAPARCTIASGSGRPGGGSGAPRRRTRRSPASAAGPAAERRARPTSASSSCAQSPTAIERHARRPRTPRVERRAPRRRVIARSDASAADRQVPVRMRPDRAAARTRGRRPPAAGRAAARRRFRRSSRTRSKSASSSRGPRRPCRPAAPSAGVANARERRSATARVASDPTSVSSCAPMRAERLVRCRAPIAVAAALRRACRR